MAAQLFVQAVEHAAYAVLSPGTHSLHHLSFASRLTDAAFEQWPRPETQEDAQAMQRWRDFLREIASERTFGVAAVTPSERPPEDRLYLTPRGNLPARQPEPIMAQAAAEQGYAPLKPSGAEERRAAPMAECTEEFTYERPERRVINGEERLYPLFRDVAGMTEEKRQLMRYFTIDDKLPNLLERYNVKQTGILLWGPPGTGKTFLVSAFVNELSRKSRRDYKLFSLEASQILSPYIGVTAMCLKKVWRQASSHEFAIIFIDEVDAFVGKEKTPLMMSVRSALLPLLDGLRSKSNVLFIGATNSLPDELDSAFRRRVAREVYVGLPDRQTIQTFVEGLGQRLSMCYNGRTQEPWKDLALDRVYSRLHGLTMDTIQRVMNDTAQGPMWDLLGDSSFTPYLVKNKGEDFYTVSKGFPTTTKPELQEITSLEGYQQSGQDGSNVCLPLPDAGHFERALSLAALPDAKYLREARGYAERAGYAETVTKIEDEIQAVESAQR